jgi:hypothetical protein
LIGERPRIIGVEHHTRSMTGAAAATIT